MGYLLIKKMLRLFFIFILSQCNACYGQELNIDTLFKKFRFDIQIEKEHLGNVVFDEDTKISFYTLVNNSSIENLIQFLNDSNARVRSKMFAALVFKGADDRILKEVLELHKHDTSKFMRTGGCVSSSWTVIADMQMAYNAKIEKRLPKLDYKAMIARLKNKPHFIVPNVRHRIIEKEQLLEMNQFKYSDDRFKLVAFSLSSDSTTLYSSSAALTEEMKDLIRKSKSGDRLFFEDMKMRTPGKSIRNFASMGLILIDN